ncbi:MULTISPECIES: hypothetical protein [Kocuria]|uniref:hypothetical protein n=1 Tax=Kocuria TaxID=57493 RepID=UPI0021A2C9C0|nr:hypothetical protein [Kocuria sp. p3-SID1428]MCT1601088.1 hypothetical protein [Kocuria sp. p3-SID1428]
MVETGKRHVRTGGLPGDANGKGFPLPANLARCRQLGGYLPDGLPQPLDLGSVLPDGLVGLDDLVLERGILGAQPVLVLSDGSNRPLSATSLGGGLGLQLTHPATVSVAPGTQPGDRALLADELPLALAQLEVRSERAHGRGRVGLWLAAPTASGGALLAAQGAEAAVGAGVCGQPDPADGAVRGRAHRGLSRGVPLTYVNGSAPWCQTCVQ